MALSELLNDHERSSRIEWRLYYNMLVTRRFEEALLRWEHQGKIAAQTFPSKGQEAVAIGCCLALVRGLQIADDDGTAHGGTLQTCRPPKM